MPLAGLCCVVTSAAYGALFGCSHLGCIAMMPVASYIPFPFSAPCNDMLAMLACATRWLSMYLYTLAYMFMHESCLLVCHSYFNTMKLWTFDLNLHLSFADTTFCFLFCLFALSLVCLLSCALLAISIVLIYFMPPSYALCIFSFHCLSIGFLSLSLHV